MTQKVLQVGSSAGITISKDFLRSLRLRIGDRVQIRPDPKRGGLLVLPVRSTKLDSELMQWTDQMIDQYGPALRALAKK